MMALAYRHVAQRQNLHAGVIDEATVTETGQRLVGLCRA